MFQIYLNWHLSAHEIISLFLVATLIYASFIYWTERMPNYSLSLKAKVVGIVLNGLIWLYFINYYIHSLSIFLLSLSFSVVLIILFIDFKYQEIPNEYSLILAILGGVFAFDQWDSILLHLGGGVALFLLFFALMAISRGAIGGGDVKMSFGLGLLLGLKNMIPFLMYSFFIAAIISIVLLALKKKSRKDKIAFGPFLAIGYILTYLPIQLFF